MSGTEWGWRDTTSGSARPQRLVPYQLPAEAEYKTFMDHCQGCSDCGFGQVRCATAEGLWQAYKTARSDRT